MGERLDLGSAIEWRDDVSDPHWDEALAALGGHPLQSALWGGARRSCEGIQDRRWMALRGGEPIWMIRYEERRAGPLGLVAWAPRGPTSILPQEEERITDAFLTLLRKTRVSLLVTGRWRRVDAEMSDTRATDRPLTIWIDLSKGKEAVLGELSQSWRRNLRKSQKSGVITVATDNKEDISKFYDLCMSVSEKKDFKLPGSNGVTQYLCNVGQGGAVEAKLFLAMINERIGSGVLIMKCGKSLHFMWGGTDREFAAQRVGEAVQWAAMEWGTDTNCKLYDLEGINKKSNPGTAEFKAKMGGEEIELEGHRYYPTGLRGRIMESVLKFRKSRGAA